MVLFMLETMVCGAIEFTYYGIVYVGNHGVYISVPRYKHHDNEKC